MLSQTPVALKISLAVTWPTHFSVILDWMDGNCHCLFLATFSLLLLCLGAALGISVLLLVARRWPKLQIASYFKALPADLLVPRPPCNSPNLSRNRRRKMRPLRPLRPADGQPRPIARVAAYSNLQEGVVFKHPRRDLSAPRAMTLAQVHHQITDPGAGPAAARSIPPLAGTYV